MVRKEDTVIATFDEEDVVWDLEDDEKLLAYIEEHGMMDDVVLLAVNGMRDWYDYASGDARYDVLMSALERLLGKEKLNELREYDEED